MKARDNPLASDRVLALIRYRQLGWTWPELLVRLDEIHCRCAIVGPKGSGKTTLVEDLIERLTAAGRRCRLIRLSAENGRLDPAALRDLRRDELLFIDGTEQLPSPRWARLRWQTRRAAGLVVTTHTPGRLPTLLHTTTSPQLLHAILADLLGQRTIGEDEAVALHARHQGNLREAIGELYDRFARTTPPPQTPSCHPERSGSDPRDLGVEGRSHASSLFPVRRGEGLGEGLATLEHLTAIDSPRNHPLPPAPSPQPGTAS